MGKVIIHNDDRSGLTDAEALMYVGAIVIGGKANANNTAYCRLSDFGNGIKIPARKNAKSDTFKVYGTVASSKA